jgi:hypothetical protein
VELSDSVGGGEKEGWRWHATDGGARGRRATRHGGEGASTSLISRLILTVVAVPPT